MIFLSLSDLSLSTCARGDEDDSAHLGSTKEAIFAEILRTGFATGLVAMVDLYFFSRNRSVKLLHLNQVITVLNRNVTESTFTYSRLITFQNTVILKGQ